MLGNPSSLSAIRTVARVFRAGTATGANVVDADWLAPTSTVAVCTTRPSISSCSDTRGTAVALRLSTPAVTTTRSCPSNGARCSDTGVTARFTPSPAGTGTGSSTAPPGRRSVSSGCHPARWKSETSITTLRGNSDSASRLPASLMAGPYLVDPAPGAAALISATTRDRSGVERSTTSAWSPNSTSDTRSAGVTSERAPAASCCARAHVSPKPML